MDTDQVDASRDGTGLADRLKETTWSLHREAERSGVIQDLLKGRAGRDAYALLLANLLPVYAALESGLERIGGPSGLADLARPALYRAAALRSDLDHLVGAGWTLTLPVLPTSRRYADRIAAVAAGEGAGLIAHAYVRYLGDLNGGQILKRLIGRTLGLGPEHLGFYDFPDVGDLPAAALAYRDAIDRIGAATAPAPILAEALVAFRLNIDLSNEVRDVAVPAEPV